MLAVAQDHVAHVADAKAVHQHAARGHLAHDGQAVLAHLDDLADLRDDDVFRPGAQRLGQLRVLPQLRILAVDGQEILGLDQRVQELDLLLAGVAGDVHLAQLAVDDVGPAAVELVDDPRHGLFIARDGVGRENDHIRGADLELAVLAVGHAGQARHGLALAAGGDDENLLVGIVFQIIDVDEVFLGDGQFPDGHGHARDVDHAAPHKAHPAAEHRRRIHHHLHAVDVGGEHRHDHAALGLLEHVDERLADLGFAHGVALALDVGRFAQERQHALRAKLGKAGQVRDLPVNGREVHFEVAAEHHRARRAGNRQRHRARDGVVDVDKAHLEAAQTDFIARTHHIERHACDTVLLELEVHQRKRQLRAVQGHGHLTQHIGCSADMVLVAVGEQHAADALAVFDEIGHVRDDKIHTQHVFLGEDGPAVHHHHILAVFNDGDVLAKFIHTAQWDNTNFLFALCHWSLLLRGAPRL